MDYLIPLDRHALDALGIPQPWRFGRADRVRFGELDPLNHVNNVAYLGWLETARVAYFDWTGFPRGAEDGARLVLIGTSIRYHAPVNPKDSYVVCVRTTGYRNTSFTTEYGIYVDGRLTTTGEIVMVCVENDLITKRPIPPDVVEAFRRDGATDQRDL